MGSKALALGLRHSAPIKQRRVQHQHEPHHPSPAIEHAALHTCMHAYLHKSEGQLTGQGYPTPNHTQLQISNPHMFKNISKKRCTGRTSIQAPLGLKPLIPIAAKKSKADLLALLDGYAEQALRAVPPGLPLNARQAVIVLVITLLNDGVHLTNSKVMWAFTTPEWYAYQLSLSLASGGRTTVPIPNELRAYMKLLRQADAAYKLRGLARKSESYLHSPTLLDAYQSAVECLHNTLTKSPHTALLLAPPIRYTSDGKPRALPNEIPRPLGYGKRIYRNKLPNLQDLTSTLLLDTLKARLRDGSEGA